ncbi:peptidase S14 [Brevundimonas sp.]|uniref:peptidase S14 n=1 Tax=Brevundimonas sp. TaxID=1871086 RepID=UPI002D39CEAC|nr:peptidase S14 [Brevundimonas sp.]HYC74043.1 peptidase S14 [Brevundimonas sp.]
MTAAPDALFTPQIRLNGNVSDEMFGAFQDQFLAAADGPDPVVLELTTVGGDADVGRRIAADIRLFRERTGRTPLFFGKTTVFSAGATIMAGFRREDRWLDRHGVLMIHCRKLSKTLELSNFLKSERPRVEALLAEIDIGIKVQTWGFEELIAGSDIGLDELEEKAAENWYLTAEQALQRGLIAGVV